MDEKIFRLFLPLIDRLYNQEPASEPFRKPVDVVKYGCYDYYEYIKHPIDLSTIREKLTNHDYKDAWQLVADVQLMFSNAYYFNKKGTPVYEYTNKLNRLWTAELTPIMQRLNYCCGTLHKFGPQLLFCHGTTPDRYCQIAIGARYKCYEDQYSFCLPCFNRIETDHINIQALSACESTRTKPPTQPVRKSDFVDCANDHWQYESFIQCTQCARRVHQICELYPASEEEISKCIQHDELEHEQKMLCQIPEEYRKNHGQDENMLAIEYHPTSFQKAFTQPTYQNGTNERRSQTNKSEGAISTTSLDDELLQFAQAVDDSHSNSSAPTSPYPDYHRTRGAISKECGQRGPQNNSQNNSAFVERTKNSVDIIAARLAINKMTAQGNAQKFVCNHCYRKKNIGLDLRHRKYSARRLPHTGMSKYIETKVNEHIREHSPSAGKVTIRVMAAYRDTIPVKKEMRDYLRTVRENWAPQHPNSKSYPDEFGYTNRAIFAWQEIDGIDVCVFGMHVQEYGEDCPEPNRQVVYLSYLDSVHFFRPKQVRTAVYHEILLSYFKYVKKLGFRRVFIWVCPSRKGDDYIFYRHPTEQKMPTLKRLSDWYINLLDKGILAGIVEKHQNIYQYAGSENWTSILSMPYLSGDYWPGEFERLLAMMSGTRQGNEMKMQCDIKEDPDTSFGFMGKGKLEVSMTPEGELIRNFERSLKRQKDGFIVARLNDCDCSPHFESQRLREEETFSCDLMKGREPFLQLARLKNYEFSTLRRAKFSSLAMVKHLGQFFKLYPICSECYSFDSGKRHYACPNCESYYQPTPPPEKLSPPPERLSPLPERLSPPLKKFAPPPPSHVANNTRSSNLQVELDQVLAENFIRQAGILYDVDFDRMNDESRKILAHYWNCPLKETCHICKFVVLSCSFMSVLMRSTRMQTLVNCNPSENLPNNASNTDHLSGIDLTTAHRLSYQPKDK